MERVEALLNHNLPPEAPDKKELRRRLQVFKPILPEHPNGNT